MLVNQYLQHHLLSTMNNTSFILSGSWRRKSGNSSISSSIKVFLSQFNSLLPYLIKPLAVFLSLQRSYIKQNLTKVKPHCLLTCTIYGNLKNLMFHFGLNYEGNNWFDKGQPLAIYGYSGSSLKAQLNPKDSPLDLLLNTAQVSKKMNVRFIVHENLNWIDVCSF